MAVPKITGSRCRDGSVQAKLNDHDRCDMLFDTDHNR